MQQHDYRHDEMRVITLSLLTLSSTDGEYSSEMYHRKRLLADYYYM